MIEITPTVFFTVLGSYSAVLVGCLMWLNSKFNGLESAIRDRVSIASYDEKHAGLELRIRNLEIQVASRMWLDRQGVKEPII